jgi:hypothetical protein
MDVQLPDGTLVKGVPDGTSKLELATKLKANGKSVPDSWLQPAAPKTASTPVSKGLPSTVEGLESQISGGQNTDPLKDPFTAGLMPEGEMGAGLKLAGRAADKVLPNAVTGPVKAGAKAAGDWIDQALGKLRPTTEGKVSKILQTSATDPAAAKKALAKPPTLVKGSAPTTASASGDEGLLGLEKTVRNTVPKGIEQIGARNLAPNNLARTDLLSKMAGTPEDVTKLKAARDTTAKTLYKKADTQFVNVDPAFRQLQERPSIQRAIKIADRLAREDGTTLDPGSLAPKKIGSASTAVSAAQKPLASAGGAARPSSQLQVSGKNLHYVKLALDQMLEKSPTNSLGRTEAGKIANTRSEFLKWAEDRIPEYKTARETFAKMSQPINRREILQNLQSKAIKEGTDAKGNKIMTRAGFNGAVKAARPELEKTLSAPQLKTIDRISKDLDLSERVNSPYLKATGSDTLRNATAATVLGKITGGHGLIAGTAKLLAKAPPLGFLVQIPAEEIHSLLVDAMLDPALGAKLLEKPTPSTLSAIGTGLAKFVKANPRAVPIAAKLLYQDTDQVPLQQGQQQPTAQP